MPDVLTAADARHWALLTRAVLASRRTEIDDLNVFPVPDGDTGTNLYLTLDGAIDATVAAHEREGILGTTTLVQECRALSRAVLLAARGNSGVIASQLIDGICAVVVEEGAEVIDAGLLARGYVRGAELARASVAHPKEGTILTVADSAAAAAMEVAAGGGPIVQVSAAAVAAAGAALERTPEQLPELAHAGVVDAGGAGCLLMLEALHRVLTGSRTDMDSLRGGAAAPQRRGEWRRSPVPGRDGGAGGTDSAWPDPIRDVVDGPGLAPGTPAYEVMFLLEQTTSERVATLTSTLDGLGDSLLVVGGPDLYNVHVHVDDAGAAIEAGISAGRPHRIRVTHFASQNRPAQAPARFAVVAVAAGPGIAAVMREAGAVVVDSVPGRRASAGTLLEAVRGSGARDVVVLPNDSDTLLAAEGAARAASDEGIRTQVVPARAVVQGLAALAVHEPTGSLQDNAVAMSSAAAATRHGAVTVAAKEALTWAGVCQPGDVLGVVDGDVAVLGTDVDAVAGEVLTRLLAPGGELVTLVVGADADPAVIARVERGVHDGHAEIELVVIRGGQPTYPLLIGVE